MKGPHAFEAYYRTQCLVADGDREWDQLLASLKKPLPVTFTVVVDFPGGLGRVLLQLLTPGGRYADLVRVLSWYPGAVAFQATLPRSEWPAEFGAFLKAQTELGTIIRQELVRCGSLLTRLVPRCSC